MISLAFLLSSLFSTARTATVTSFLYVFAGGLLGELLFKVRACVRVPQEAPLPANAQAPTERARGTLFHTSLRPRARPHPLARPLQVFMDRDDSWMFYVEWVPVWSLYRCAASQQQAKLQASCMAGWPTA